jgi:hypothetical protein
MRYVEILKTPISGSMTISDMYKIQVTKKTTKLWTIFFIYSEFYIA